MRVLTLTANLLAETTYTFDAWSAGATQRAKSESFQVGGKGINVSRMLQRLGVDTQALCFPGGATGARCEAWLREQRLPYRSFTTPRETRTGAVVRAPGQPETTFLGAENGVSTGAIAVCAGYLDAAARSAEPDDRLILAGSVPAWDAAAWNLLRAALAAWADRDALVVDTYGPPLAWAATQPARLVKINRRELAALIGVDAASLDDAAMPQHLARVAREHRVARWVITDGPNRVWFCERGSEVQSNLPPQVEEVSATGSGDVFLAALVHAMDVKGLGLADAVAAALPLAAANAASPGIADFDLGPFGF